MGATDPAPTNAARRDSPGRGGLFHVRGQSACTQACIGCSVNDMNTPYASKPAARKSAYGLLRKRYEDTAKKANGGGADWEFLDASCDEAWNDLIDFVEKNNLSGTALDPRFTGDDFRKGKAASEVANGR